jgi:glutathione S-transferase
MDTILSSYAGSVVSLLAVASLVLAQVAIATAAGRRAHQVHGMPITAGHDSFAFRAHRAHQNSLENLPLFATALAAALLAGASPVVVDAAALTFAGSRAAHAAAYYAGAERPRTGAFAVGLLAILTILGAAGISAINKFV